MQAAIARDYSLEITNEQDKARLAYIKNQPLDVWINILDDNEPHLSYADYFEKFKTMFAPYLEMHRRCINHKLLSYDELIEHERTNYGLHK